MPVTNNPLVGPRIVRHQKPSTMPLLPPEAPKSARPARLLMSLSISQTEYEYKKCKKALRTLHGNMSKKPSFYR